MSTVTETVSGVAQGVLSINLNRDSSGNTLNQASPQTLTETDLSAVDKKTRSAFPKPPTFETKEEEREYLKFRLAQAFRIFGSLGYDEGVAGHITVRVSSLLSLFMCPS